MEQGRLLIAIVLSVLVFTVWGFFFQDNNPPAQQQTAQTQPDTPLPADKIAAGSPQGTVIKEQTLPAFQKTKDLVVNTPFYSVTISDKGAFFKSFMLKKYRESVESDSPNKELITLPNVGSLHLSFSENSISEFKDAVFLSTVSSDSIDVRDSSQEVSFLWTSPSGIVIEKQYTFYPDSYLIGLNVIIKNGSGKLLQDHLELSLTSKFKEVTNSYGFEGPSALINNTLEQIDVKDLQKKNVYSGKINWTCLEERYFLSSIVPVVPTDASIRLSLANGRLDDVFVEPEIKIESGVQRKFQYNVYMGPKSHSILSNLGIGLDKAIHFGFFDILAKPLLWLLNFLHDYIPNYGAAIIVLTLIIKGILWPLGSKSYKSMSEMKKIQPLMAQIREKYKDDKKKMNEETMALYKTYKVNPLGGCLPMVVQIPVFFALYRMLYEAIELRHAPFIGWITDLAAPDRLLHFSFSIPFMEPPYGIPVLTIIMGATMFIQQKMSPPMGDPMQAKMMMMMPIVFTFIFINFSSGLVLYWLINNIVSISQQYYIQKKYA
ncbi:MAG: membrane protein insertase YidC [Pseudomonadota bacterium]